MDFYTITTIRYKRGNCDYKIHPKFNYSKTKDIVCKGGEMYAWWNDDEKVWETSLASLINRIDRDVRSEVNRIKEIDSTAIISALYMNDDDSGIMDRFRSYTKNCPQSDIVFDSKIIFHSDPYKRSDYSTRRLPYDPSSGSTKAFDELIDTLYEPVEKEKIMWFMGLLLTGSSSKVQKFMFLHGGKGTGKGTVIKIFKDVFADYYSEINLQNLTSDSQFAAEDVKEIPLLVDEDCDMSAIKKDTALLKLTAHEPITVNRKYMKPYTVIFTGLLITASNQPYKVRDVDSGIMRRAVTVYPSNKTFDFATYHALMERIKFEIPAIAQKAIDVFNELGVHYYNDYEDKQMAAETDYFLDFMREKYDLIKKSIDEYGGCIPGSVLSVYYYDYLTDNEYQTAGYKKRIRSQAKRYFTKSHSKKKIDGKVYRNVYEGLLVNKMFDMEPVEVVTSIHETDWLNLSEQESVFDKQFANCYAQYATEKGTPTVSWANCKTKLKDINTKKLHYIRIQTDSEPVTNHVIIDFDLKNEKGEKDLSLNILAASAFPETYAEISKSGEGLHLHYIYDGDVTELDPNYDSGIEVKVYVGKSSIRRQLTKCNSYNIAHLSSGLPLKEKITMRREDIILNDKGMHTAIRKAMRREYDFSKHTKPNVDFIAMIFEEAQKNGVSYDLSDLKSDIITFASLSTNQKEYCLSVANNLKYVNMKDLTEGQDYIDSTYDVTTIGKPNQKNVILEDKDITFFDIEVLPNMNLVVIKPFGKPCIPYFNPTPKEATDILSMNLMGFNNRRYDNHILYAISLGWSPGEIYELSKSIIGNGKNPRRKATFGVAYGSSYGDLYDISSKKQSLKKWEVEMDSIYDELEFDFDKPLPELYWDRLCEYCIHDVEATEKLLNFIREDYNARLILSQLSGLSVNTPGNTHVAKILFGDDSHPEKKFVYTDLSTEFPGYEYNQFGIDKERYSIKREKRGWSPKSIFMGEDPSEGGYVWSEPGIYTNVAYLDVTSLHPSSLINMNYFGPYTKKYEELKIARVHIKNNEYDKCKDLFDGKLRPFLDSGDESKAPALANALKIILNSVYGMTSAKFDNPFKDPRNIDNIVAKRGALFMILLKNEVQKRGYSVAHIKTDSIKIPNADDEIINFAIDFAKKYGYDFKYEKMYTRMALINRAILIGQDTNGNWEAVGPTFAEPYVYKTLFSKEQLELKDFFQTKEAKTALYLGNAMDDTKNIDISQFEFCGRLARVYASNTGYDLLRYDENNDGYSYVTGTKGYKWKHASEFKDASDIDMSYYESLIKDAINDLNKVGPSSIIIDDLRYSELVTYY